MVRKWALLYMKLKVKMWSLTVQCKNFIATLVIIAGMLDTSEKHLAEPIPSNNVGKNPLIFNQVSD